MPHRNAQLEQAPGAVISFAREEQINQSINQPRISTERRNFRATIRWSGMISSCSHCCLRQDAMDHFQPNPLGTNDEGKKGATRSGCCDSGEAEPEKCPVEL